MKPNKQQLLYIKLAEDITDLIYKDAEEKIEEITKEEENNKKELLSVIANIMLMHTIENNIVKLTIREKNKTKNLIGNFINKKTIAEAEAEVNITYNTLLDTIRKKEGAYYFLNNFKKISDVEILDRKKVEKIIFTEIEGKNYSDRIWKNKNKIARSLQTEVRKFLDGKTDVNNIKKVIDNIYKSNSYNAARLIENEVARVQAAVNEEIYKANNTEYLLLSATLDKRTCKKCGSKDGRVYERNDKSRPKLPIHVKCRCDYIEIPDKNWRAPERIVENKKIENYKTFKEWLENK